MCQKWHVSMHFYHNDLQNSCHVGGICHVPDNITSNVPSILQMYDSKFLVYCKSTPCQYLLSNKISLFKPHPYKTWLLIRYCQVLDILEWQSPITIIVGKGVIPPFSRLPSPPFLEIQEIPPFQGHN